MWEKQDYWDSDGHLQIFENVKSMLSIQTTAIVWNNLDMK